MMELEWQTLTRGQFDFDGMCNEIKTFIEQDKDSEYVISVGTDSQKHPRATKFVVAVVVHRVGHGAQYYWLTQYNPHINSLKQKIMLEASLTLNYKEQLKEKLVDQLLQYQLKIVPDSDIGRDGKTRQFIPEIIGMFKGYGKDEEVRIKPYSMAASTVADKHSK